MGLSDGTGAGTITRAFDSPDAVDERDGVWPSQHDLLLTGLASIRGGCPCGAHGDRDDAGHGAARSLVHFVRERLMPHARAEEAAGAPTRTLPSTSDWTRRWPQREHEEIDALADELERVVTGDDARQDGGTTSRRLTLALEALVRQHLVREAGCCTHANPSDPLPGPTTIGGSVPTPDSRRLMSAT